MLFFISKTQFCITYILCQKHTKTFNLDDIKNENNENHNALLHLIKEQDSDNLIDKISLYAKDLKEPKYRFLIQKREDVRTNI